LAAWLSQSSRQYMESPNISTSDNFCVNLHRLKRDESLTCTIFNRTKNSAGFTLLELLIVMGLFAIILSFGLAIGFDSFRRDTLKTERTNLVSALQKARSQAVNNIDNNMHGFYFDGANYIVFEGTSFATRDTSRDLFIPRNSTISLSGLPHGVVFEQLSGDATPAGVIVLEDGISSTTISINEEGRIEW
jgi:prepilin-type N-terminal cleavage/methylation domain-containing protein